MELQGELTLRGVTLSPLKKLKLNSVHGRHPVDSSTNWGDSDNGVDIRLRWDLLLLSHYFGSIILDGMSSIPLTLVSIFVDVYSCFSVVGILRGPGQRHIYNTPEQDLGLTDPSSGPS